MIKLPYGKPIYQRLYTRFTSFPELMSFLEEESFTGYLELESWEGSGKVILKEGKVTHVVIKTIEGIFDGKVALDKIYKQVEHPECSIDVYELPEVFTEMIKEFCHAELLYYRLDSRFTDAGKLLEKLSAQKHFGLIEVEFEKPRQTGIIYLQDGKTIKIQMVTETPKKTYARDYPLKRLLKLAGERPATINVYSVQSESGSEARGLPVRGDEGGFKLKTVGTEGRFDAQKEIVREVGELFGKLESILKKVKEDFDFNYHLRKLRVELAGTYPFLDPFAGEIEYKQSEMKLLVPPAKGESLEEGLKELVLRMVDVVSPFISEGVLKQTLKPYSGLFAELGLY